MGKDSFSAHMGVMWCTWADAEAVVGVVTVTEFWTYTFMPPAIHNRTQRGKLLHWLEVRCRNI